MMQSKFLTFKEQETTRKTKVFFIYNKEEVLLGKIVFRPGWRKYVFQPEPETVWDDQCLNDIINALNTLTAEWRKEHTKQSAVQDEKAQTKETKTKKDWQYNKAWWMPDDGGKEVK